MIGGFNLLTQFFNHWLIVGVLLGLFSVMSSLNNYENMSANPDARWTVVSMAAVRLASSLQMVADFLARLRPV